MTRNTREILYPLLRLIARLRSKKYDHIVTSGYNCELAMRFYQCNKFLDSTLFSWAAAPGTDGAVSMWDRVDEIFTGDIIPPSKEFPLFRCVSTNVRAHGRAPLSTYTKGPPPSAEFIKAETDELKSRFAHLKEKTLNYLRDDKSVLVIYKVPVKECETGVAVERVDQLLAALKRTGARNMTMLIICEHRYAAMFPKDRKYEVRSVYQYNSDVDAANRSTGDKHGWRLVFDEFRPKTILKQKHKFKFEQENRQDDR